MCTHVRDTRIHRSTRVFVCVFMCVRVCVQAFARGLALSGSGFDMSKYVYFGYVNECLSYVYTSFYTCVCVRERERERERERVCVCWDV